MSERLKILLVGEYSGVHATLASGLRELGHEVVVVSGGDGWKGFPSDFSLNSDKPGLRGKLDRNVVRPMRVVLDASRRRFDVVQFMAPVSLLPGFGVIPLNHAFYSALMRVCGRSFLLAAGDDSMLYRVGRHQMRYTPWDDYVAIDLGGQLPIWADDELEVWNRRLAETVDGVIPVVHDYAVGYREFASLRRTIPLPMDVAAVRAEPNRVGDRIVVYHGISRPGFKGTRHVREAFGRLGAKHPDAFELIIADRMPIDAYLKTLARTNIVVDQVNSYSYGMNALYAMALGKIVLSGAEPECLEALGVSSCPVVNVEPSADDIVAKLEELLGRRDEIEAMGSESRSYVERVHGHRRIAQRYLDTWLERPRRQR